MVLPARAPKREGDRARCLSRELEPARGGERQPTRDLAHDSGQARRAQALLHDQQNRGGSARLDVEHTRRVQADAGERGGEQVVALDGPEHRPPQAR